MAYGSYNPPSIAPGPGGWTAHQTADTNQADAAVDAYLDGHLVDIDEPPAALDDAHTIGRRLKVARGSDVKAKKVNWVIEDWVPAGALTLLAGREGLGKSTIACKICADITLGTLEGELHGAPRNILYVHTEDAREFTVAPRLKAAGADMDKVLFVDVETDITSTGNLVLPADTANLESVIEEYDVALVVLDAATSSMASDLSGKDDRAVRQFLEPLSQMAARQNCVILGLVHFGKRDGADSGKLILGSIAWSQVARSVLSVAKDDDTGNIITTNTKGNLAPRIRSMESSIISRTITPDDGEAEVGVLQWIGETSRDARDLLQGDDDLEDDRNEIKDIVYDYLISCGGSAPASDVLKVTRAAGLNDSTVKKSRKKIGVTTQKAGMGGGWVWSLDNPKVPEGSEDSHTHEKESSEPSRESSAAASPINDRFTTRRAAS